MKEDFGYAAVSRFGVRHGDIYPTVDQAISALVFSSPPQHMPETRDVAWERLQRKGWRIAKVEVREVNE